MRYRAHSSLIGLHGLCHVSVYIEVMEEKIHFSKNIRIAENTNKLLKHGHIKLKGRKI